MLRREYYSLSNWLHRTHLLQKQGIIGEICPRYLYRHIYIAIIKSTFKAEEWYVKLIKEGIAEGSIDLVNTFLNPKERKNRETTVEGSKNTKNCSQTGNQVAARNIGNVQNEEE